MTVKDYGFTEKCDMFLERLYEKHFSDAKADNDDDNEYGLPVQREFDTEKLGNELGFDWMLSKQIAQSLFTKKYIIADYIEFVGSIAIGPKGIDYIEKKHRNTKRQTTSPIRITATERSNVQVIQNSHGNTIYNFSGDVTYNDVENVLSLVRASYDMLKLNPEQKVAMDNEIEQLKNELKNRHPNKSIIEKSKSAIMDVLTQAGGSLLASGIIYMISNIH